VIVPNYTQIATPNSVKMLGAVPVFCDVEPETLCLDIEKARAAVGPRTKAVMLVAANGRYPKAGIAAFESLAREHGLVLIEDSAQALGSRFPDGRHMGTVGLVGSFSFSVPKIITTGQGGCLITNDDAVASRLRKLKDFGRSGGGNDIHDTIGWNFKFTDVQAAIGIEQMKKLAPRLERKKAIYRRYRERLASVKGVSFFEQDVEHCPPWFIDVRVKDRDALAAALKAAGIGSRIMYPPIHRQKAYDLPGSHPVSEEVGLSGLWLPSASQLRDEQIDRICNATAAFYGKQLAIA
jgi:perosamine synthetase